MFSVSDENSNGNETREQAMSQPRSVDEEIQPKKQMSKTDENINKGMEIIQSKTDFPAVYVVSILIFCGLLTFIGFFRVEVTNFISFIFPIYWTIKDLKNLNRDIEVQWEMYWLIYFVSIIPDWIMSPLLAKIPYYYFVKYIFLVWCFLPSTMGALQFHDNVFRRIYDPVNVMIVDLIEKFKSLSDRFFDKIKIRDLDEDKDEEFNNEIPKNKYGEQKNMISDSIKTEGYENELYNPGKMPSLSDLPDIHQLKEFQNSQKQQEKEINFQNIPTGGKESKLENEDNNIGKDQEKSIRKNNDNLLTTDSSTTDNYNQNIRKNKRNFQNNKEGFTFNEQTL